MSISRRSVAAALAAAVMAGSAWAQGVGQGSRVELSGVLEWKAGLELDGRFQTTRVAFEPEIEATLGWGLHLAATARLRMDTFDRLEPGTPSEDTRAPSSRRQFFGQRGEFELRELYLEGTVRRLVFTLGKQHVVWGTADGLKVLDLVNPQSFREFILEDFESSRTPLWAAKLELPIVGSALQLLWIADNTYHEFSEANATFAFTAPRFSPLPPPGVPLAVRDLNRADEPLSDSDFGLRLSTFWNGFDLTFNYLYHYFDVPVPFRTLPTKPGAPVVVEPGYERTHLVGGTATRALSDWVVRTEVGYSTRRYLGTADGTDADGVVRTGDFSYVIGLDWYGLRDTLVSAQIFQSWLPSHRKGLVRDFLDTNVTLLVRRTFLHETLTMDAIWIHNVNDGDGLLRPRAGYELTDAIELEVGLDLFYGPRTGVFGQFDERDRIAVGIRWSLQAPPLW